jgi:hypothetical protein
VAAPATSVVVDLETALPDRVVIRIAKLRAMGLSYQ